MVSLLHVWTLEDYVIRRDTDAPLVLVQFAFSLNHWLLLLLLLLRLLSLISLAMLVGRVKHVGDSRTYQEKQGVDYSQIHIFV